MFSAFKKEKESSMPSIENIETRLFIDGKFVEGAEKKKVDAVNPATEEVITSVSQASAQDVDRAVEAARRAFEDGSEWRRMPGTRRRDLMLKLASLIERDINELAQLESMNNGKPVAEDGKKYGSMADLKNVVSVIRYYAGHADKLNGQCIPVAGGHHVYTIREPVGVCAMIIPWNFPTLMMAWKISPALAMGCTLVVKPSTKTPLTALKIAALSNEAGFPPGVLNVLCGHGGDVGKAMASHADVDKVAFTGSTKVGHDIQEYAATSNLKRVSLELGGKSPLIVFDDANMKQAVETAHSGERRLFWGGETRALVFSLTRRAGFGSDFHEYGPKLLRGLAAVRASGNLRRVHEAIRRVGGNDLSGRPQRPENRAGPFGG